MARLVSESATRRVVFAHELKEAVLVPLPPVTIVDEDGHTATLVHAHADRSGAYVPPRDSTGQPLRLASSLAAAVPRRHECRHSRVSPGPPPPGPADGRLPPLSRLSPPPDDPRWTPSQLRANAAAAAVAAVAAAQRRADRQLELKLTDEGDTRLQLARWMKLEGGTGCPALFNLCHYLALTSEAFRGRVPLGCRVPDTVLIKQNAVAHYFHMDGDTGFLTQKDKYALSSRAALLAAFGSRRHVTAEPASAWCATWVDASEVKRRDPAVEYLTGRDVAWLLAQPKLPDGLLQQAR